MIDNRGNAEVLQDFLLRRQSEAEIQYSHNIVGFAEIDGETVFLAQHPIGRMNGLKSQSQYAGAITLGSAGTLDDFKQILLNEVIGHPTLELALAISFVPLLVYFLRQNGKDNDLPIYAFVGPSSTGKTTSLRLIASVYGSPVECNGLIGDFVSTDIALSARLSGLVGMPLLLDEATDSKVKMQDHALSFAKGHDRYRSSSGGRVPRATEFVGAFVLTSEKSVLDDRENTTGASARVVEFILPWTDDADHAMRMEAALRVQHGAAVVPLVETALKYHSIFPKFFKRELRLLKDASSEDNAVEERQLKALALIMTAATFIKTSLGIELDKEALRSLLIEQHRLHQPEPESRDKTVMLYDSVQAYLASNHARMIDGSRSGKLPFIGNILGEFCEKDGRRCAWIVREEFDKFLRQKGYPNTREALQALQKRRLIYRSNDRHYAFERKLVRVSPKCYCVFLP